jgi:hypothetical protein
MADLDADKEAMDKTVSHFLANSTVKNNGIREVSKSALRETLDEHGVTDDMVKKVQRAIDFTSTAAGRVALHDLEEKVTSSSADDLANADYRKDLRSTVRLPTHGGSTEITAYAETTNPIPSRGVDGDGNPNERGSKTTYGRLRTSVNLTKRIHVDLHAESSERMRKALNIKD